MTRRFRDRCWAAAKLDLPSLEGRGTVTPMGAAVVIGAGAIEGSARTVWEEAGPISSVAH